MQQSYALIYLRDVLGIRGLPLVSTTSPVAIMSAPVISSAPKSSLVIWVDGEPSADQKEMAEKMLAAIECHNVDWQVGSLDAAELYDRGVQYVVRFGSSRESESSAPIQFLNLPELSQFLGTAAEVREVKKDAWVQLKKLKMSMTT